MTKIPPGWYVTEGYERRWDGRKWTADARPLPPTPGTPAGWIRDLATTTRWWTGTEWSPARLADDGHVDVKNSIGQAVISVSALGGTDKTAIDRLMEHLKLYPPCRIEQVQTYHSGLAPGTELIAVISWTRQDL